MYVKLCAGPHNCCASDQNLCMNYDTISLVEIGTINQIVLRLLTLKLTASGNFTVLGSGYRWRVSSMAKHVGPIRASDHLFTCLSPSVCTFLVIGTKTSKGTKKRKRCRSAVLAANASCQLQHLPTKHTWLRQDDRILMPSRYNHLRHKHL